MFQGFGTKQKKEEHLLLFLLKCEPKQENLVYIRKNTMTAQDLFEQLLELKEKFGTLDVPLTLFSYDDEDRHQIDCVDIFYDNGNEELHSIDLNFA